jgi:hypothetical protein
VIGFLTRGLLAGAAGTTALNAATYVDMSVRARPASELPQHAVERVAEQAGTDVPGSATARRNRLEGLGPLAGIATGLGIGVAASVLRPLLARLPLPIAGAAVGAAAMAATDLPLASLQLTDPKKWSASDWLADALPHLAYGAVTAAALRRLHG